MRQNLIDFKNKLWVEKYRPKTIDEYIFHDIHHKQSFLQLIKDKNIPHLLLTGTQGCGKTAIMQILVSALDVDDIDVMIINASNERGIDTFREKILGFISSYPNGDFKVVVLEEADQLTKDAQFVLRNAMEEYSITSRFILTCNNENKIEAPIKSRCQTFRFKAPDIKSVIKRVVYILQKENVKYQTETIARYVEVYYPDVRKIINSIQQNVIDGELYYCGGEGESDYKFKILDYLEVDSWVEMRKLICESVSSGDEWDTIYRFLYDNLNKSNKFKQSANWEKGIVIIAEHIYRHAYVSDPEINMAACLIRLGQL